MSLTILLLTFNEERNIAGTLQSLTPLGGHIVLVDSGSTDQTLTIAEEYGVRLLHHPFESHSRQWEWALEACGGVDWILALDADQRLSDDLRRSITAFIANPGSATGAYLCRRQVFRGRWIRYGGYYPKYLLKLFRRDSVDVETRDRVDHHFLVNGPTVRLGGDLIEQNFNEEEIYSWIEKHNRYARLQAAEESERTEYGQEGRLRTPDERTAFAKRVWRTLPLYARPFLYFSYRYFLRLGFLDGKEGFEFHFLQALWYRLLVDINIDERRKLAIKLDASAGRTTHRKDTP